jgi:hypothetical protein
MLGIRAAIKLSFMEPSSSPRDVLYPWKSLLGPALCRGTCARKSCRVALDPKFHGAVGVPAISGAHLRECTGAPLPC